MSFKLKIDIDPTSLNKNNLTNQSNFNESNNNRLKTNLEESFKLNNLNLNPSMDSETITVKLPQSTSSSSIALLNSKSKALKNLKLIEAGSENSMKSTSNYLIENLNSNNINLQRGSSTKMNDEPSHEDISSLFETSFTKKDKSFTSNDSNLKRNNAVDIFKKVNDPESFATHFYNGGDANLVMNNSCKFDMFTDDMNGIVDSISSENNSNSEVKSVHSDPEFNFSESEGVNRMPSNKGKPKPKGFALFGRKNKHQASHFYYNTQITRNSIKAIRAANKKNSNKIDWTENSKNGMHIWSECSIQTNDCCYLNDSDNLKFHKIGSSMKCASSSKNVPKKKCNICKIVIHESCSENLQQNVKCRTTYRENLTRKKSFRDKELGGQSSSAIANADAHHWICHKFDENSCENKCKSCQKSYTNRFGIQTNRTIVSCSWCKQAHHLKCFDDNPEYTTEECRFGEHKLLMVPPSWIVKLITKSSIRSNFLLKSNSRVSTLNSNLNSTENHSQLMPPVVSRQQSLIRNSTKAFIIRPPSMLNNQSLSMSKPLLVLINPKSGGKVGPKLLKKFTWYLNARQVFDLSQNPKFPIHLYRNVPNLRVLVGGGDGSVGWVLSVIDQIKFLVAPPSIAVLPLGTGNDMARALNWGGTYNDEPLGKILTKVLESRPVKLDRWKISTVPNPNVSIKSSDRDETAIDCLKNDVFNNYFSLGTDAHIALEFHEKREANPQKFTSRWFNLYQYLEPGIKDLLRKSWKDLKDYIQLECDGVNYTDLIRRKGYHFLIFLNITKYGGGTSPWGGHQGDVNYQAQSMNDGRIEVIGCYTSHIVKLQIGGGGERICQAKHVKLTTSIEIPIQIDGEPAKINPSIIEITHKNQASMLEHIKNNNADSPILGYNPSIHKHFEVKCILLADYKKFCKETKKLELKAISVGTISTSNLLDNLSKVREIVNVLIKNCINGFYSSKWSFLSAEEFYKIGDDSDECLLDIVSTDEIIYILDESPEDEYHLSTNQVGNNVFPMSNKNLNKTKQPAEKIVTKKYDVLDNDEISHVKFAKIPSSQTIQQISSKQQSIPSSKSTQFNPKVPSYI